MTNSGSTDMPTKMRNDGVAFMDDSMVMVTKVEDDYKVSSTFDDLIVECLMNAAEQFLREKVHNSLKDNK